jgi:regulator of RNase E activity RraA
MGIYAQQTIEQYEAITTATITTVLFKHHGLKNVWIRGALPLQPGQKRVAGPAFTLRFVPAREDLCTAAAWSAPISTRSAIEEMPANSIAVMAAGHNTDAGVLGDILCQRMKQRGVAAMLTDGVVRDFDAVRETGLSIWAQGVAAPPAITALAFIGWQQPVGCGGVAIFPDGDGAVVIPAALVDAVLETAIAQEALEDWIMSEVKNGVALPGLYPPNEDSMQRYRLQQSR